MENIEEIVESGISSQNSQGVEAVEDSKMKERCGNVIENKESRLENWQRSGDVIENTGSYALETAMLLKKKDVGAGDGR
jgi:hypothetical protein